MYPHDVSRQIEAEKDAGNDEEHLGDSGLMQSRRRVPVGGSRVEGAPHRLDPPDRPGDQRVEHADYAEGHGEGEESVEDVEAVGVIFPALGDRADLLGVLQRSDARVPEGRTADEQAAEADAQDYSLGAIHGAHPLTTERIANRHETLDREGDHEPGAEK